jgi:hypothetical protein
MTDLGYWLAVLGSSALWAVVGGVVLAVRSSRAERRLGGHR